MMNITQNMIRRFWSKVDVRPFNECWEWIGSLRPANHRHYGQMREDGKFGTLRGTHRVSFEIHYGPIPEGLLVMHSCDHPTCVRPDHLSIGTHQDNVDDREKKRRELKYIQGWW